MKNIIIVFTTAVLFISCGKEETKFEAFSAEAFAYDLGGSWEVNASTRVKGMAQKKTANILLLLFRIRLI
ncbi:MAG: hypothetical protein IPH11_07365 [Ignavibacteriales bacterium]|nr:hypothetical protein [Ignavibacteriales bacterium]